jgi:tRNA dimethylallyltransferase
MMNHLVIVGPTASGKTGLSLKAASLFGGAVICADSRTVYKEMDIGTAKPTPQEQAGIKHYCLDLAYPNQEFTVADFKQHANAAFNEIAQQNTLAITVGGSGLYVDSFIYNFSFTNHDATVQRDYKDATIETLQKMITKRGLALPENNKNKRYLLNVLARGNVAPATRAALPPSTVVIGLQPDSDTLRDNIRIRADYMFKNGVAEEVEALTNTYGKNCKAMQGGIYSVLQAYIEGREDMAAAKEKFIISDWHLAKRQRTWFKRNPDIKWFENADAALAWLKHQQQGTL